MSTNEQIVQNLTSHYTVKVMSALGDIKFASTAMESIAKNLQDLYRYFEPEFFKGNIFLCFEANDNCCLEEEQAELLYDKNTLLNEDNGDLIIQVFGENDKLLIWKNNTLAQILEGSNALVYHYNNHKECFYANGQTIDITIYNKGSRFATQFKDVVSAINTFAVHKIYQSSCTHFNESWAPPKDKRLFFRGGGSGNNIPEKFMQISLHEFMTSHFVRGIKISSSREYNVVGDYSKPKPVDIKIEWKEANRTALVEIKFIGTVKKDADGEIYSHGDTRANTGITQLKGYHDGAKTDAPSTILKSFLIVIDGRRNNLVKDTTSVNTIDGMFYKDVDISIDENKKFHGTVVGFEKPIKIFSAPVCE